jgi:hypothetical protein
MSHPYMLAVGACAPETTLSSALSQIDYLTKHVAAWPEKVATWPEKEISDISDNFPRSLFIRRF